MSKISKFSTVTLAVATGVWLSGVAMFVPVAQAQGLDLQAQINLLLEQVKALQLQLAAQGGSPAPVATTFTRDLTLGSTGDDVKALQQWLNSSGFPVSASGAGAPGSETTYFGARTQAALAKYQAAKGITPSVGYFGPKTRAFVNSIGVVTPPIGQPPVIPGTGLVITLASDSPSGVSLPKGATGVSFLKFNVSGSGTLDSLTFKRVGVGATGDFASAGVYLYEGATRLTNGKSVNSTTHEVTFVNLALAVSGSRTFTLVADLSGGATTGNRDGFTLVGSTGTPTPSGVVTGSEMAIAGQAAGGLTVNDQNSPANPKIGQKEAPLVEVLITASSTEDIWVDRISFTEGGTITNTNLSNFVLKQNGVTVATAASIGAKDLVTLIFNSPFKIEKGQNRAFVLHGDIAGSTRADDTIIFYLDSKADVLARGATYGYPVLPDITGIDTTGESTSLTVQGGDITVSFNGPIVGNIPLRGQDQTIFDFTIASANNIEIKNLRLNASTTNLVSGMGFNDFKLWDTTNNSVISSATDITTSTNVTVTDVINFSAGQSKRFKVTVDVDADNGTTSTIQAAILAWQSGDIRNLDNNTNAATSTIVPSGQITGNTQTTIAPGLEVQLSGAPASDSFVKGATNVPFVGFSLRATNDDIKITSLKISASTTGATSSITTITSDLQSLALYDGATKISDSKSLTGSALPGTATFSNLNYTIKKGETKTFTVKGNISAAATAQAVHFVYLAATTDISAIDSQSNSVTITGSTANSGATAAVTTLASGDVTVAMATQDGESKARLVIAGATEVLGKFRFTSANEAMTVNKLSILVTPTADSATATSTAVSDEVSVVKLYDGATGAAIGNSSGYSIIGSGASSGIALVDNLGWALGKNEERILVVKGVVSGIDINSDNGADSGASLYTAVMASGFEAVGSTALDTTITAATSTQKIVVRGRPTVTWEAPPSTLMSTNPVVARFRVAAGATPVAFKTFSLKVEPTGATMTAVTTSNVTVYNNTKDASAALTLATVVSGSGTASTGTAAILGGATGYVTVTLGAAEEIGINSSNVFDVRLTFNTLSASPNAKVAVSLSVPETTAAGNNASITTVLGATTAPDGNPAFAWSDFADISHSESTTDWHSGFLTELPVSSVWQLTN
ncbi:MAG: Uncharacterized protein G01um101420_174 [Parcubacteria group bacterium Gr01-1014_20]|nr:MAG: Uncharacterized protein G01um101420_174 [Parcubacteria group bacterium Gr01-1014_20]